MSNSASSTTPATPDIAATIWPRFLETNEQVRHFNTLQSNYRTMASTWLLAALAALGFFYSTDRALPVERDAAAGAIAIAAAVGIGLLWVLDVLVYHELLVASDEVGRQLECEYPWLPQIRHTYGTLRSGAPVRLQISLFYLGSAWLLLAIAAFAIGHLLWWRYEQTVWNWVVGFLIIGMGSAAVYAMYRIADKRHEYKDSLRRRCPRCEPPRSRTSVA